MKPQAEFGVEMPAYPCAKLLTHRLVHGHELYVSLGAEAQDRQAAYRELFKGHLDERELEGIRACLQTGTPLGNDRFREQIEQALQVKVGYSRRGRPQKSKENH